MSDSSRTPDGSGTPGAAASTQGSVGRPRGPFAPELRSATIGATALISLFALEYIAVGAAMPTVARALDGHALYSMAFAATVAASVMGMVLGGWWSDRSGPRPAVVAGTVAFALGLLICGAAPTMGVFIGGRTLQGLGSGLAMVALYVVIAQRIPDDVRPRVFSLLAAAWVVPGLVGPLFTGAVVDAWGWRWVFLLVVPCVVLALAVLAPALRHTHGAHDSPYLSRSVLVWAAVAALSVALLNLTGEQVSVVELAVGVVVLVLLGLAARRLLPPGTLRLGRGLPSVVGVRGLLGASFLSAEAFLPLLLQDLHGYTPGRSGLVLAVASVTWALGSAIQGRLPAHTERTTVMLVGMLVYLLPMLLLVPAYLQGWAGWTIIALYGAATLGVGLAYPSTTLLTMRLSPPGEMGRNSSGLQVSESLTSALGLAVAGAFFGSWYAETPVRAFTATAVVAIALGLLGTLAALRSRPSRGPAT